MEASPASPSRRSGRSQLQLLTLKAPLKRFVRPCGGMRSWESALECVICNSDGPKQARAGSERRAFDAQASLKDWQRAWSQHAPLTSVRHDLAKLKADIAGVERGSPPAMMGPEYKGVLDFALTA